MRCDSISLRIGQLGIPHPNTRYMCELRRARPMQSFSDVSKKLLQTKYVYITQSVVCAMMWQLTSIDNPPWYAPTYWPYVVTTHQPSIQHYTNRGHNLTVTFRQRLYWLGYGWSSALLNCLILWNMCDIASYPKGRLVEQVTLLNSSILTVSSNLV